MEEAAATTSQVPLTMTTSVGRIASSIRWGANAEAAWITMTKDDGHQKQSKAKYVPG